MNKIKIINYISIISIPMIILIIVLVGIIEKKPIFDLFIKGAIKGIEITLKIFPTLIGLFFAIGLLKVVCVPSSCTSMVLVPSSLS